MSIKQNKTLAVLRLLFGTFCILCVIIALTTIDVNSLAGRDMGVINKFIVELRKGILFGILVVWLAQSEIFIGKDALFGKEAKIDLNANYRVIAIETDDSNNMVKLDLVNTVNGDKIVINKQTKNLRYFKSYLETNGDIMPGSFAKCI